MRSKPISAIVPGLIFLTAGLRAAPVDFGRSELAQALKDRGLAQNTLPRTNLVDGKPECYSVTRDSITGTDDRGLMYGLLEAADQIRAHGQTQTNGMSCRRDARHPLFPPQPGSGAQLVLLARLLGRIFHHAARMTGSTASTWSSLIRRITWRRLILSGFRSPGVSGHPVRD